MQGNVWPIEVDPAMVFMAGAWLFLVALFIIGLVALLRGARGRAEMQTQMSELARLSEGLTIAQAGLQGRLEQTQSGVNDRLDHLTKRVSDSLFEQGEKTGANLRVLHERLAVIDAAQKNISQLSEQVVGLQDILSNKQARGAFGEVQLHDLVTAILPASGYAFQVTLTNRSRADCLLKLPDPPGPMVIDAKFPLESFRAMRDSTDDVSRVRAARAFSADVGQHIRDIAEKYIVPGDTADSALMFLPSEAVYAELHANFRNVVEDSYRRKVWIVSPTTLWATLNTVRAVMRDVHLQRHAHVIQAELRALAGDVGRLDDRVGKLQRHFEQAVDDVRQIRITTEKVTSRAGRLDVTEIANMPAENSGEAEYSDQTVLAQPPRPANTT